jgi:hypothetical protein
MTDKVIDFEAEVVRLGLPLWMKAPAARQFMQCGATKLRELIYQGKIDALKRDKDVLVKTASILKYNASLPAPRFKPPYPPPHRTKPSTTKTTETAAAPARGRFRVGGMSLLGASAGGMNRTCSTDPSVETQAGTQACRHRAGG